MNQRDAIKKAADIINRTTVELAAMPDLSSDDIVALALRRLREAGQLVAMTDHQSLDTSEIEKAILALDQSLVGRVDGTKLYNAIVQAAGFKPQPEKMSN